MHLTSLSDTCFVNQFPFDGLSLMKNKQQNRNYCVDKIAKGFTEKRKSRMREVIFFPLRSKGLYTKAIHTN